MKYFFELIRVDYWPKNIMVIPGFIIFVLLSGEINNYSLINPLNIFFSIVCILLVCSSNYVLNEILDRNYDKHHPEKKHRPMVLGDLLLDLHILHIFHSNYLYFKLTIY